MIQYRSFVAASKSSDRHLKIKMAKLLKLRYDMKLNKKRYVL